VESTVVGWDQDEPVLLRAGGIALEALEEALGKPIASPGSPAAEGPQITPGALPWHYAPRTPLRLIDPNAAPRDPARGGLLWFGPKIPPRPYAMSARVENLSASGNLREAAANLFAALHRLDAAGLDVIHATTVPESGLGRAINERLRKAAAKKV
jgi:L-threonylcarbamoyladenylate synthase